MAGRKKKLTDNETILKIIEMKKEGFSEEEVFLELASSAPLSRPTVRKYYKLDSIPDDLRKKLQKPRKFDAEPFHSMILSIVGSAYGPLYASSVYDVLEESFIDTGEYECLPGCERTLRNYLDYLKREKKIDIEVGKSPRIYRYVPDMPPGSQMLVDFGQEKLSSGKTVHFIALMLRYSRYIYVYAQAKRFTAETACASIYRCFRRIGGRPRQLVIDQDAVFVSSELYGEVITTEVFGAFLKEQELELFTCNKADPETKGGAESAVKTYKTSFLSARRGILVSAEDAQNHTPAWCARKNSRISQATYRKPQELFEQYEKPALGALLPSVYDLSPESYTYTSVIAKMPYISYGACKYSVPESCVGTELKYKVIRDKLHIYDKSGSFICTHTISMVKGERITLPEHKNSRKEEDYLKVLEELRGVWDCEYFHDFTAGILNEMPRFAARQLRAIRRFLDEKNALKQDVTKAMGECCRIGAFSYTKFQNVYLLLKEGYDLPRDKEAACALADTPGDTDMSIYQQEFEKRM